MIKGLVSIIIPTYNRADSVAEALRSAQAQTYPSKQIIVVDDGSSDDTARRVAEFAGVEYYYQENRGQGAARNHGLRHARGEYVASLDSDDLWDEDFLARSVECLEASRLGFVFTNWVRMRGAQFYPSEWLQNGRWKSYRTRLSGEWSLLAPAEVRRLFLETCPAPSSSLVVRRDAIVSGWGEHMQIADDWYLLLEMALRRPCSAAFSLTPRWTKRVDGSNVYDGRPFAQTTRQLYLRDFLLIRRDFASHLTRREKLNLSLSELKFRLHLRFHEWVRTDLAARARIPSLVAQLRGLSGPPINRPEPAERAFGQED